MSQYIDLQLNCRLETVGWKSFRCQHYFLQG